MEMEQNGELAKINAVNELVKGQMSINEAEAKSSSVFVAGWRPFIGWVCGSALAYQYIISPFLVFTLSAFSVKTTIPVLEMSELMTLLFGILGLGAMRTFEKKIGIEATTDRLSVHTGGNGK
jgi:hypothetical protein